jgi:uncharacterized protein YndB with AHSA1/START domain
VSVEKFADYFEPVRKSITVGCSPEHAFEVFTRKIASWWPLATHSIFQSEAVDCVIEPHVGGEIYERSRQGERYKWGHVLAWEPPRRLILYWHPGADEQLGQEVELTFHPNEEGGTRVDLEHRKWAQLGADAEATRNGYDAGWESVFVQLFRAACEEA